MTSTVGSRRNAANEQTPERPKRSGTMLRVPEETHAKLKALAEESGESMSDVLATAVEQLRRKRMMDEYNAAYAAIRNDPVAWEEELAERRAWDATLADGLEYENWEDE